ncbi:hypothetical protein C8P66_102116 [Humitalea rosea]|uniref:Uncharacterized protein n=2 Tax=Humitalea rosea TaxID=990373 RepID=A0A2W7JF82_9PROT|nr:hypothetical protein C8P66_102116 [Humitalea rosea]
MGRLAVPAGRPRTAAPTMPRPEGWAAALGRAFSPAASGGPASTGVLALLGRASAGGRAGLLASVAVAAAAAPDAAEAPSLPVIAALSAAAARDGAFHVLALGCGLGVEAAVRAALGRGRMLGQIVTTEADPLRRLNGAAMVTGTEGAALLGRAPWDLVILDMGSAAATLAALAAARPGLCLIHTRDRAQEAAALGALSGAGWRLLGDEPARYGRAGAARAGAQLWGS